MYQAYLTIQPLFNSFEILRVQQSALLANKRCWYQNNWYNTRNVIVNMANEEKVL